MGALADAHLPSARFFQKEQGRKTHHGELAEVNYKEGDNEKAYEYFLGYDELKDSVFNVKKINEIANIEFTYQVAMKVLFNSGHAFAIFTAHHFLEGRMNSMIRKK